MHKLFEKYGQVTNSKTLARIIVEVRKTASLQTTNGFKDIVSSIVKGNPNKYFAQVFQALRIEVNDEFGALKEMLEQAPQLLKKGGRVAVITFHSLEDRIVKNFLKGVEDAKRDDVYGIKAESLFKVITKKPIIPGDEEIKQNPRARSAKLRIAVRKIYKTNNYQN